MANLRPGPIANARNIVTAPGDKPLSAHPQFIEKVRVGSDTVWRCMDYKRSK